MVQNNRKNIQKVKPEAKARREQIIYADLLFYGCWIGIFVMLITYFIYLAGLLPPYVSFQEITYFWSHDVHSYIEQARIPIGWGWIKLLNKGDFLNFLGIAFLAMMTLVGFITLIPAYVRQKDWIFVAIVISEIIVIGIAASGVLKVGGH